MVRVVLIFFDYQNTVIDFYGNHAHLLHDEIVIFGGPLVIGLPALPVESYKFSLVRSYVRSSVRSSVRPLVITFP